MPRGLQSRARGRGHSPCQEDPSHEGRKPRRWLGVELGRSPTPSGERRACRAEEKIRDDGRSNSCRIGRREERESQVRGRRHQGQKEKEKEGKEEGERKEERKEEEVQHQRRGGSQAGWHQSKEGKCEEAQSSFFWDRPGPKGKSQGKGGSPSPCPLEKEESDIKRFKVGQWGQQHLRRHGRRGSGHFIQRSFKGEGSVGQVPRSPLCAVPGSDAREFTPEHGRRRSSRHTPRDPSPVLPAGATEESKRASTPRVVYPLDGIGFDPERKGFSSCRSSDAAYKESRAHAERQSLERLPEAGGFTSGRLGGCRTFRSEVSPERCLRGLQSPLHDILPGGEAKGERTRQRENRWERRSRTQRRSAQRQQRRTREERPRQEEGGRGKEPLRQTEGGNVAEGEAILAERIEAERNFPHHVVTGAAQTGTGCYEEGMEVAFRDEFESNALDSGVVVSALIIAPDETSFTPALKDGFSPNVGGPPVVEPTGTAAVETMAAEKTPEFGRVIEKSFHDLGLSGKTMSTCGSVLLQKLLEVVPLRSKTTGKREKTALFPLPTSRTMLQAEFPDLSEEETTWMITLCISLNSFWGGDVFFEGFWSDSVRVCLENFKNEVKHFCQMDAVISDVNWSDLFLVKSVDYKGDEVKVARWFQWCNVGPALPKEVGKVPLVEVCTLGSKHYVEQFDLYLKPRSEWGNIPRPRVMVADDDWGLVCKGLVDSGVCTLIREDEVFDTGDGPLLNGMFGVTKDEFTPSGTEIFRLIMNLIPLNRLCRPMSGDVDTLPSWSAMSPFFLQPSEQLLVSSEDVKCFFYTMSVPDCWVKYLAFNKAVPDDALPDYLQGEVVFLASRVLPMGFLNSVSLAQHVHRNLVSWSAGPNQPGVNPPERELRKDRPLSVAPVNWRVYLDNYDLLEKVQATNMVDLKGTCAPGVLALRNQYEEWQVPRNLKKAVERSDRCEVQGATVDGVRGCAYPRESKLSKYFSLALSLCSQERAQQRQWQVVCGGLVYVAMFRRPMLGSLNRVWTHIESYNHCKNGSQATPTDCRLEVLRFLGMLPLGRMDFRLPMHEQVTCSDASTQGGGACASSGLTPVGRMVAAGSLRGEVPENAGDYTVLCVGLFDGISALRVALDLLGVQVLGHVSIDKHKPAQKVVESHYPGTIFVDSVEEVDYEMVLSWATRFSQCNLVLVGAGPPCQGVSGLNFDRKGALLDQRSNLFTHVPRIKALLQKCFPWCPTHHLMESVASMDSVDRKTMSRGIQGQPLFCDAGELTWCRRPRLYWVSWEIPTAEGYSWTRSSEDVDVLHLEGCQALTQVLRPGWIKVDPERPFPTFTTSRPSIKPGRKPAGVAQCSLADLERWSEDSHRFPPYQYKQDNCVVNRHNELRVPDVSERELMLGFPYNYTLGCLSKSQRNTTEHNDTRLTLLGNSWSVPVVASLLQPLFSHLGFIQPLSPQDILDNAEPGRHCMVQGRLVRLPWRQAREDTSSLEASGQPLCSKLGNLISIKGEDILLTTPTSQMAKFHRLRASVPGKLWRWKVIAGWKWTGSREHINSLELRAIFTTLRWRVERQHHRGCRFIHLTDSLVCLHALSRGRSSSRKLRRTMARLNALVLAANLHPVWGYIHTDQNPADKPSRWGQRVKTKFRNAGTKTRPWSTTASGASSATPAFRYLTWTYRAASYAPAVQFSHRCFSAIS